MEMRFVVDTNIIISALLREGLTRKVLLLAPIQWWSLTFVQEEIEQHRDELLKKSRMDEDDFHFIMKVIFERISIVDDRQIQPYKNVALKTIKDIDNADFNVFHSDEMA